MANQHNAGKVLILAIVGGKVHQTYQSAKKMLFEKVGVPISHSPFEFDSNIEKDDTWCECTSDQKQKMTQYFCSRQKN